MAALLELDLGGNLIDDDCVEVLVQGLVECKHLRSLDLSSNMIGDDGLDALIRRLPSSVDTLKISCNEIALARQLSLLRFRKLDLACNALSSFGPRVIAASLANPECQLEQLYLYSTKIGDEGAATIAPSLRDNQRLTFIPLENNNITESGWNEFLPVLCNTGSINATHGSNHMLRYLGDSLDDKKPQDVKMILELNSGKEKSRVAASKILQTHSHLDMRPLFGWELDLLPYVVAWLERFAESRFDLKLSSTFEFVRAMPMKVVDGVAGKRKGKKPKLNN